MNKIETGAVDVPDGQLASPKKARRGVATHAERLARWKARWTREQREAARAMIASGSVTTFIRPDEAGPAGGCIQ